MPEIREDETRLDDDPHHLVETDALPAEQILGWHADVLKDQLRRVGGTHPHLVERAADREAGAVALDEEH